MSNVTNVILTCAKSDEAAVNAIPLEKGGALFFQQGAATCYRLRDVSGQQVLDALGKVKWSESAAVRLLIQEQGDAAFRVWVLIMDANGCLTKWYPATTPH